MIEYIKAMPRILTDLLKCVNSRATEIQLPCLLSGLYGVAS